MLGMITTTTHKRIVAEKDAEIAGLMKRIERADFVTKMNVNRICQLLNQLAPFTTPRARDSRGRFIKDTVA